MTRERAPRIADGIIYKKVGEELVLLDFERGTYFGLDEVGARIWQLVADGLTPAAIAERIVAEYDVDIDVAARDVEALLDQLAAKQLVID